MEEKARVSFFRYDNDRARDRLGGISRTVVYIFVLREVNTRYTPLPPPARQRNVRVECSDSVIPVPRTPRAP